MDLGAARRLFPLVTASGLHTLDRIRQHACAPRWTHEIGDHLVRADLEAADAFRRNLAEPVQGARRGPPRELARWAAAMRERVWLWRQRIPAGFDFERDWAFLPTMDREALASTPELLVPHDEPLDRLIVYETSGTTGHALRVPHHPGAVALLHPLAERALAWHGQEVPQGPDAVACMNVRAQASVWVYASIFTVWREAGFARVNLNAHSWSGGEEHARRFIGEFAPGFLSGDPASFSELLRLGVETQPRALLSTALALTEPLKRALEARFRCPVIDWYSTTETGPVACSRPGGEGLAVLAPDLYVEALDEEGLPVPEGQRGELAVSGGRNPYLPLLRYRTGDFARLSWASGEQRIIDLEGRAAVVFRAQDGTPVNSVDIGRVLRHGFAVVQHEFLQRADGSCAATLRPAYGLAPRPGSVEAALKGLFGEGVRIDVTLDETLGRQKKAVPFRSELPPP
jgi:phenylacetate-CoA ligase